LILKDLQVEPRVGVEPTTCRLRIAILPLSAKDLPYFSAAYFALLSSPFLVISDCQGKWQGKNFGIPKIREAKRKKIIGSTFRNFVGDVATLGSDSCITKCEGSFFSLPRLGRSAQQTVWLNASSLTKLAAPSHAARQQSISSGSKRHFTKAPRLGSSAKTNLLAETKSRFTKLRTAGKTSPPRAICVKQTGVPLLPDLPPQG
jgi:hypothetical protein